MNSVTYTLILFLLLIIFVNQQPVTCQLSFSTVITVGHNTMDVAQFAADLKEFVTGSGDREKIIKTTDQHLQASTSEVLTTILLQSNLEKIDDAVVAIHSSLEDVKKLIQSTDKNTFETNKDDFISNFKEHTLIKHIRFLPNILKYWVPGTGSELLTELIQKTRCNMTALEEFSDFYLNLLADGIAVHLLYSKFTTTHSFEQALTDEWKDPIKRVRQSFESLIRSCAKDFPTFAQEDVDNAVNIDDLVLANQQRYIYNWTDVFFYASMKTEQFHYMKNKGGRLFHHDNGNKNKVAVFGRRGEPMPWNAADIEKKLKRVSLHYPSETKERAAKIVAQEIEQYIKSHGYSVGVTLVFFDGDHFEMTGEQLDKDSPVVQFVTDVLYLEYCVGVDTKCTYQERVNEHKKTRGVFRVYVYPGYGPVDPGYVHHGKQGDSNGAATYQFPSLLLAIVFYIAFM